MRIEGIRQEMTPQELKDRTKALALRIVRLVDSLPRGRAADVIGRQILRSATSVGANYRSACRSCSDGDFLSRMGIVEEEADETLYWLELLAETKIVKEDLVADLMAETDEILAIIVSGIKTARQRTRAGKAAKRSARNPKSEIRNAAVSVTTQE